MPITTRWLRRRAPAGVGHSPSASRALRIWPTISRGAQVAHQRHRAGMAERAGQAAADLGRQAERAAPLLGDQHALDLLPVGEAQEPLAGAVARALLVDDLRPRDGAARGEAVAQRDRQGGHAGEVARAAGGRASATAGARAAPRCRSGSPSATRSSASSAGGCGRSGRRGRPPPPPAATARRRSCAVTSSPGRRRPPASPHTPR